MATTRRALDGYESGPGAPTRATARALERVADAAAVVLVEGISDQVAVETAAAARGRRLGAERVVVVPIGGAHAIRRSLAALAVLAPGARRAGLCDRNEAETFRCALVAAGVGSPRTRADMERLGFHVCVEDLEDELVRAVGVPGVEGLLDAQGDLGAFRALQGQPAWRGREPAAQVRRFLGSGAHRKLRYARLLVELAAARGTLPRPLDALLAGV